MEYNRTIEYSTIEQWNRIEYNGTMEYNRIEQ